MLTAYANAQLIGVAYPVFVWGRPFKKIELLTTAACFVGRLPRPVCQAALPEGANGSESDRLWKASADLSIFPVVQSSVIKLLFIAPPVNTHLAVENLRLVNQNNR
ncbi:MAG: hypothetical protein ACE5EY_13710 [Anaerolineae bacterium]